MAEETRPEIVATRQAETTNDSAFATNTQPGPKAANAAPPTAGPIRKPTFPPRATVPFAQASSSGSTSVATAAFDAATNGDSTAAATKASRMRVPGECAHHNEAKQTAPTRSEATITRRRSNRSPSDPAIGVSTPRVPKVTRNASETIAAEWVSR